MHAVTCWNDKSDFNKPKRFAKQQRSNVDIALASVYCYCLRSELTGWPTTSCYSCELLTAADRSKKMLVQRMKTNFIEAYFWPKLISKIYVQKWTCAIGLAFKLYASIWHENRRSRCRQQFFLKLFRKLEAFTLFTLFGKLLSQRRHHMVYCRQCVISNCSENKEHHPNQPDIVKHLFREILVVGEEAIGWF